MDIPFKRVVWNEHEAALLVETYEKVKGHGISRKKAIVNLSARLRNRMILDGVPINDKYRNVAGIDLQLLSLEKNIDANGDLIEDCSLSRTFRTVYLLSKNSKPSFDVILSTAKEVYPEVKVTDNPSVESVNVDLTYSDVPEQDTSMVREPSQDEVELSARSYGWNKFEASLLINGFHQISNRTIIKEDIITLLVKRFGNCSPVVNRRILPSKEEITEALQDIEQLSEGKKKEINSELQNAFELYQGDSPEFYETFDSAKKLYPLEKSCFFLKSKRLQEETAITNMLEEADAKIMAILAKNFPKGYRLNSYPSRKRFASLYATEFGTELTISDECLDKEIADAGITYRGIVYLPTDMIDEATKQSLFKYIDTQFARGIVCVYYEVLFEQFSQQFLGQTMIDSEMLRMYLEYYDTDNSYHFESEYFSKGASAMVNISKEVIDYVKSQGGSVTEEEIVDALSFLPKDKVIEAFSGNRQTLVLSGIKTRFHIDNFQFEKNDRLAITDYLSKEIKEMQYVTFTELYNRMGIIAPRVIENNIQFNQTGIRTALSSLLGDEFHFVGSFISDHDNPISIQDAFIGMGRNRESFTIEEVEAMANDFNAPINFDALAVNNVRVSEELYVSKQNISFNIAQVDKVIERFCKTDFISLSDVITFTAFPECGYRWTPYLLESYVYAYSNMFTLEHKSFNKTSVAGAIVRRTSRFNDYNDVMAAALANAEITLDVRSSLDFLAQNGYIERRRLNTIEEVIRRAEQLKMK